MQKVDRGVDLRYLVVSGDLMTVQMKRNRESYQASSSLRGYDLPSCTLLRLSCVRAGMVNDIKKGGVGRRKREEKGDVVERWLLL